MDALIELSEVTKRQPGAPAAGELSASALILALKTVFDPAAATDATGTFALDIDGDWFGVTVAGSSIDITPGRTEHPAVILAADAATLRSVALGREPITAAERDGRLTVLGSRHLAERFTRMFPAPHDQQPE